MDGKGKYAGAPDQPIQSIYRSIFFNKIINNIFSSPIFLNWQEIYNY